MNTRKRTSNILPDDKASVPQGEALHNGEGRSSAGDAGEPEAGNTSFDPAALDALPPHPQTPDADPFDPASLRLTQNLAAALGVKKALLTVPVRKPDRSWFVRVHPDERFRLSTAVIELREERETYLVAPALWPALTAEATFSTRALFTAVNRQGAVFLWPVRLPGPDGRLDEWSRTALESAQRAMQKWSRVVANMAIGGYELFEATGQLPEPEWPDLSLRELLRIAFKDRLITAPDHPVLRRLRGEA